MIPQKLTLSAKLHRLRSRLRDPEWRRYGYTLMLAKFVGISLVVGVVVLASTLLGSHTAAADTGDVAATDIVNPINTMWTLVAAFLVFGMQVGFTMLEAGFCRSRETVNVLVEC